MAADVSDTPMGGELRETAGALIGATRALLDFPGGMYAPALERRANDAIAKFEAALSQSPQPCGGEGWDGGEIARANERNLAASLQEPEFTPIDVRSYTMPTPHPLQGEGLEELRGLLRDLDDEVRLHQAGGPRWGMVPRMSLAGVAARLRTTLQGGGSGE